MAFMGQPIDGSSHSSRVAQSKSINCARMKPASKVAGSSLALLLLLLQLAGAATAKLAQASDKPTSKPASGNQDVSTSSQRPARPAEVAASERKKLEGCEFERAEWEECASNGK